MEELSVTVWANLRVLNLAYNNIESVEEIWGLRAEGLASLVLGSC